MTVPRKVLGVIGGMGSAAAADFFTRLVAATPAARDQEHLEVVLHNNSRVPDRTAAILGQGEDPRPELLRSCRCLEQAGVDLIVIACLTSHAWLADLQAAVATPILDAPAEIARHCRQWPDRRRVGVMATTGALQSRIFHDALAREGLEIICFDGEEQEHRVMAPIYGPRGVKAGFIDGEARDRLVAAARLLCDRGAELVVAGCTEIPLALRGDDLTVPLVDVTDVLARRAVELCGMGG